MAAQAAPSVHAEAGDPMAARRAWTPEEDARIVELHGQGRSLHSIAKEIGCSKQGLSHHSAALGLQWDRTRTAAAVVAKVADARARRADLELRALSRAEALYARLEAEEFHSVMRAEGGREVTETLTFIPARDERDIAVTIRTHIDASLRLNGHDAAGGAVAVIGLLQQTAAALGIVDDVDAGET